MDREIIHPAHKQHHSYPEFSLFQTNVVLGRGENNKIQFVAHKKTESRRAGEREIERDLGQMLVNGRSGTGECLFVCFSLSVSEAHQVPDQRIGWILNLSEGMSDPPTVSFRTDVAVRKEGIYQTSAVVSPDCTYTSLALIDLTGWNGQHT